MVRVMKEIKRTMIETRIYLGKIESMKMEKEKMNNMSIMSIMNFMNIMINMSNMSRLVQISIMMAVVVSIKFMIVTDVSNIPIHIGPPFVYTLDILVTILFRL
jgi:hypothetical protein